ncbi:MAG: MFS transporter [Eubacteriaceae bacterium]
MKLEKEQNSRSTVGMYALIFIAYFFVNFHRYAGGISAPILIQELSFTPQQIGWFGAIFTYCYAFANLPAGILIDKFGSRKLIGFLYIGAALGTLLLAMSTSFIPIIIGRGLIAMGIAPVFVAACKVIAEWETPERFSVMNGYLMAFGRAGGVIASTPLVILIAAIGWRNTYFLIALISLMIGVGAFILIKEKCDHGKPKIEKKKNNSFEGLGKLIKQYQFWFVVFFMMAINATIVNVFANWGGVFLTKGLGYSNDISGNILLVAACASVCGALLSGFVIKKTSARFASFIGGTVLMVGTAVLGFFTQSLSLELIYFIFILMGLAEFYTIASGFSLLRTIATARFVGTAIGTTNFFIWGIGASVVAQLWGMWIPSDYAINGFQTAFIFHFVTIIIGLIALFFTKEKPIKALEEA